MHSTKNSFKDERLLFNIVTYKFIGDNRHTNLVLVIV